MAGSVNDFEVVQASSIVNALYEQSTGQSALDTGDMTNFITVGQKLLKTGYDPVLQAISQVLTRTVFPMRPYDRKFRGVEMDESRFGNAIRKLHISDSAFENGEYSIPTDGQSVDHYKIKRANIFQENFYGSTNFELQSPTIFREQLDVAFSSPAELVKFWGMITQNAQNMIEKARETMNRAVLTNFIAGKIDGDTDNVIHLLSEYNAATGQTFTKTTIMQPANYKAFMQWAYARVEALAALMTEYSELYHMNITGHELNKSTPYENLRTFIFAPAKYGMEARALADTYHDSYLRYSINETVNYWQSIETPDEIDLTPTYLDVSTGGVTSSEDPVQQDAIFGLLVDQDAVGSNVLNEWVGVTPLNAKGGYTNIFYHFRMRWFNSFVENGIVLLLD